MDTAVGTGEGHAIDLTVRVHSDRASVGILNSGNGTEYFHQFRQATKNHALCTTSGLWVGGEKQGDGNCAVRANHMAERTLLSRELARRLATLRRAMYAYAYDRMLPGNQGTLALGTMLKMGLISLGGWGPGIVEQFDGP